MARDRAGAQAAQQPRGKRRDQGRRDARGLDRQAGQDAPDWGERPIASVVPVESGRDRRPLEPREEAKTHGTSHYGGTKNHVNVDRRHKLIRRDTVSDAAVHDSQAIEDVLDDDNTASDVWADSACRSAEIEKKLENRGLKSRIHRKAHRNRPLTKREQQGNTTRSKVRARVEHVFGAQTNDMGGTLVRSIGIARARARIGLKTLACTMRRAVQLDALAAARAPT